jgi:hypothetical protein
VDNNPIKQHTVPQLYLRFFADNNGGLWVFDKKKCEIRKQPVKDTTILRDFYTLENENGEKDYKVEVDLFSNIIEKEFAPVLNSITNNKKVIEADRKIIFNFVIFQLGRTTKFNNDYREIFKKGYEEKLRNDYKDLIEKRKIKRIEITPHKNTNIKGMVTGHNILSERFKDMGIVVLETRGVGSEQFLTSDNPVILLKATRKRDYEGNILDEALSLVYFPLSPNLALLINDKKSNKGEIINKETVGFLNDALINQSDQYIISRGRKNLLNCAKKDRVEKMTSDILTKIEKYC